LIRDANGLAEGTTITADVCIVGGGPAGLVIATELQGSGLSVVVLESGGEQWDRRTQGLAAAEVRGESFLYNGERMDPEQSRLRQLGGTSNHWTGMCRPFDALDFERRDAVAHSGWPFGLEELEPYYRRAAASCQLATAEWDAAWWSEQTGLPLLADGEPVGTAVFQFSPPTLFAPLLRPRLADDPSTDVILWANVTSIETDASGRAVTHLRVATLEGRRIEVEASRYVLAVGGMETPRLLLASDSRDPAGVGNGNDLVGRFFMDHPHHVAGRVLFARPVEEWLLYTIGVRNLGPATVSSAWAGLRLSAEAQAAAAIGNASVQFWPGTAGQPRGDRDREQGAIDAVGRLLGRSGRAPTLGVMSVRTEQEPDPDSRIVLSDERDALGVRRLAVDWRVGEVDRRTVRETVRLVGEHLAAAGLARIEVDPSAVPIEAWPIEVGNHHMGTARIHADPDQGVVDADCRMHEVDNLYVAGSAVFPTSGMANPTLTIVALAHRLADHLRG
jgi:choline dehydrogenase-like flavoprotein